MVLYSYLYTDPVAPVSEAAIEALPAFFAERIKRKKAPAARAESLLGAQILLELLSEVGIFVDDLEFFVGENGRPMASLFCDNKESNTLPIHFFNKTDSRGEKVAGAAQAKTPSAKSANSEITANTTRNKAPDTTRAIDFNVSHSNGLVAVALAVGECARVGIDVEKIGRGNEKKLAERYFSPAERDFLEVGENFALDFARVWTRKEAMLKYTGDGIGKGLLGADSFSPPPSTEFTELLIKEGFVITLCHRHGDLPRLFR